LRNELKKEIKSFIDSSLMSRNEESLPLKMGCKKTLPDRTFSQILDFARFLALLLCVVTAEK